MCKGLKMSELTVYIIQEGYCDNEVRAVTLSYDVASKIVNAFSHLTLKIVKRSIITDKKLSEFLNVDSKD